MTVDLNVGFTNGLIKVAKSHSLTKEQVAYLLATAYWETNHTMLPVEEGYYLGSKADTYRKKLRYYPFYGRGFVQLTWEFNYRFASSKVGVDLVANPGLALEKDIAAKIAVLGMKEGWFTGRKLSDYFTSKSSSPVAARAIINGKDKAEEIARIYNEYLVLLKDYPFNSPLQGLVDFFKRIFSNG